MYFIYSSFVSLTNSYLKTDDVNPATYIGLISSRLGVIPQTRDITCDSSFTLLASEKYSRSIIPAQEKRNVSEHHKVVIILYYNILIMMAKYFGCVNKRTLRIIQSQFYIAIYNYYL